MNINAHFPYHHYSNYGHPQTLDVPKLIEDPRFKQNRCPFIIDWQNKTAVGIVPNNPSCFQLQLSEKEVRELKKPRRERTIGLHLRLFSSEAKHEDWSCIAATGITVYINKDFIPIHSSKQKPGAKKKGYRVAKPLDISDKAQPTLDVEIHCQTNFTGICVAELATFYSMDQMIKRIIRKCRGVNAAEKKCEVCNKNENLMRCSRCKTAWYCGEKHQQQHWEYHQRICKPFKTRPNLPKVNVNSPGDDELQLGESRVSLRCPLTIKRMELPVRGVACHHPQCFDLQGYLGFCMTTGVWQCPVCTKSCRFTDLGLDDNMEKIIKETGEEIDQVRLFPNGTYRAITLAEIRREDQRAGQRKKRKRKDKTAPTPSKKPSIGSNMAQPIVLD